MPKQDNKQAFGKDPFTDKEKIDQTAPSPTRPDNGQDQHWLMKNLFSIAQQSAEPVCIVCGKNRVSFYNDAFAGLIDQRHLRSEQFIAELLAPLWASISPAVESAWQGKESKTGELALSALRKTRLHTGKSVFSCLPIRDEAGEIAGLYCTFRPTVQTLSNLVISCSHESPPYRNILEEIQTGVMQVAEDTRILYANRAIKKLLGYNEESFPVSFDDLLHPKSRKTSQTDRSWHELWYTTSHFHIELPLRCDDGSYILTNNEITLKLDDNRKPAYALIATMASDKEFSGERRNLFLYDQLTSLPSRNYADLLLNDAIDRSSRTRQDFAVLLLNINRFKQVNESLGHEIGDELLKSVAIRLATALRREDIVVRMGNDEFIVILQNVKSNDNIDMVAHNLLYAISRPMKLAGHDITISASIGCSVYPRDSKEVDSLLKYADIAMIEAKRTGMNAFRFFNRNMSIMVLDQLLNETSLMRAMEKKEFLAYYQPRLSLKTGKIVGLEALIRWNHPHKGLIPASDFILQAERIGLIRRIGEFMLKTVANQLVEWRKDRKPPIPVAINVSSAELYDNDVKNALEDILDKTGLSPGLFELEITETGLIENLHKVHAILTEIRQMGITVSIDDFGTGYSSLGYLSALPADYLKIDSSFIADITVNKNTASIVETTINLAHSLHMHVIAEGVSTQEQLEFLVNRGCDQIQGYLCSRPLSPDELDIFLDKFKPSRLGLSF